MPRESGGLMVFTGCILYHSASCQMPQANAEHMEYFNGQGNLS